MLKHRWRTFKRNFLRDRIVTNGEILREFQRDRAAISTEDWPEEASRLDALIEKYGRRHESLLTKFKEA